MKKKGLIISTVVMVVVLIASLTTATYAWFNSTAAAKVDGIVMSTQSATSLQIGLLKNGGDGNMTAPQQQSDLIYGSGVKWVSTEWQGSAHGVGSSITFDSTTTLAALSKSVSIATKEISGAGTEKKTTIHSGTFFKAEGEGYTTEGYDLGTVEEAKQNVDYIDVTFAVIAVKEVKEAVLKVTVTADTPDYIGMAAAIRFAFYVDGKLIDVSKGSAFADEPSVSLASDTTTNKTNVSAFDGLKPDDTWALPSKQDDLLGESKKDDTATWTYYLPIKKNPTLSTTYSQANAFTVRVIAWIEGTDESCLNETAGTGATIELDFESRAQDDTKTWKNGKYVEATP